MSEIPKSCKPTIYIRTSKNKSLFFAKICKLLYGYFCFSLFFNFLNYLFFFFWFNIILLHFSLFYFFNYLSCFFLSLFFGFTKISNCLCLYLACSFYSFIFI